MIHYRDFSIRFLPSDSRTFDIHISSPAGDVRASFQLPQTISDGFEKHLRAIGQMVRSTEPTSRALGVARTRSVEPEQVGRQLFDAVFQGPVHALYQQSLGMMSGTKDGLRVRIIMDPSHPSLARLAQLPWELMCRQDTGEFLSLANRSQIVRFLEVPRPYTPLPFKPPFRVLVALANPTGVAPLNLDHEVRLIEQSWGSRSDVQVDYLKKTTKAELQRQLGEGDYHVLHFMGHGHFDAQSGRGVLILEDDAGGPEHMSGEALGVLLADEPTLKLAFLNACNTAQSSGAETQDPFSGVASALVLAGVPGVVAMQFPITDEAAIAFSKRFYEVLPQCYPLDFVVSEARKAVYQVQENRGGMEWATPAVFMRSPDGMIFESVYRKEPLSEKDSSVYSRLGSKVRQFWIEGKLDRDIPIKPPVELNKELVPHAIQRQLHDDVQEEVPAGKTTATLFDEKERSLLILGDPGYGKTITLLALAQHLLQRFDKDPSEPIPVVLYLSTWANSELSIKDWAAREIFEIYKISDTLCKDWIESGRIVLLLDGLDELDEASRSSCIRAINDLSAEQIRRTNFHGLAVCCRFDEYQQHPERIDFEGAIRLHPLTPDQIRRYLDMFGDAMEGLQQCLEQDRELLADAQSPLILGMLSVAYRLNPAEFSELTDDFADQDERRARHKLVVRNYLDRVFAGHKEDTAPYTRDEMVKGLSWLAKRLRQHSQSVFLIENMQPTWLRNAWERALNHTLFGLVFGFCAAAALAIAWRVSTEVDPPNEDVFATVVDAHHWWFIAAPIWAVITVLFENLQLRKVNRRFKRSELEQYSTRHAITHTAILAVEYSVLWIVVWMALWFLRWNLIPPSFETTDRFSWLSHPFQSSISVSLLCALRGRRPGTSTYIGTSEALRWSWARCGLGLLWGLAGGCLLLGASYLFNGTGSMAFYLPLWCVVGLLFGGFHMDVVKTKTRPNEGIMLSLRNSLLAAGITGPLIGVAMVTILMVAFPFRADLNVGANGTGIAIEKTELVRWSMDNCINKLYPSFELGACATLIAFLWFGGVDVLRHYALRLTLKLTGNMPLNLPVFFDHAASLILLQRIGGGYIFQNHLLKDYFENMSEPADSGPQQTPVS